MSRTRIGIVAGVAVALLAARARGDDLHAPFDGLLQRYVDADGRVAYRNLQQRDSAALDAYLASLAATNPASLAEPEQIAFWINAYNARVLRGVLDGYSAESLFGRKRFFSFYGFPLAGRSRTLDEIEHEILRKQFREPRIHFALVCASTSCPILRGEAYRGDRLDRQLDEQTRAFLADPRRNQLGAGDTIKLSSIFKWFGEDFAAAAGSVPAFVRRYHPVSETARIEYLGYDWTLNAQSGQRPS